MKNKLCKRSDMDFLYFALCQMAGSYLEGTKLFIWPQGLQRTEEINGSLFERSFEDLNFPPRTSVAFSPGPRRRIVNKRYLSIKMTREKITLSFAHDVCEAKKELITIFFQSHYSNVEVNPTNLY